MHPSKSAISKDSGNLTSVLIRTFGALEPAMSAAYSMAAELGGNKELDFTRDSEASFNPRAARIPLILIKNAQVDNAKAVEASILSTVTRQIVSQAALFDRLHPEVRIILGYLNRPVEEFCMDSYFGEHPPKEYFYATQILIALHLDRVRHLHLSKDRELWQRVWRETIPYIEIANSQGSPLSILLSTWHTRFQRQLENYGPIDDSNQQSSKQPSRGESQTEPSASS